MGATLGGGTPEQIAALEQYGFNLGLAFQITDDILDLIADSEKLGKTAGIDLSQGKGFAAAASANGHTTGTAVLEAEEDPGVALKRKLMSGNYIEEGRQNARQLAMLANMSLDVLPPSSARDQLQALAFQAIERDH